MHSYLLKRRGYYHFRIRVPADLSNIIPSAELVKSLKTRDLRQAHVAARTYLQSIIKTFSLFRSGFLTEDHVRESINAALGRKLKEDGSVPYLLEIPPDLTKPSCRRLSSAITQFISDRKGGWSIKTKMENESSFRLIIDIVGDVNVKSIDRDTVRDFRDTLCKLPGNLYKIFPEMTLADVLQQMETGSVGAMSITSVNKHLSRFVSLMAHCVKEKVLDVNPAEGLTMKQKRKKDEERKAYAAADLKMLLERLPREEAKPERYWIPLIGMYSGMRLDEICQLHTEDVKAVDGVWCLDVNDTSEKKLKTQSSYRLVPIHPTLIDLGFLDYVQKGKDRGQPRLWMNLHRREADGYASAYGKVFQRFNRKHITTDPLKTFHSLRHTFADSLKQVGVQESIVSELMGHTIASITTGRYGKRYKPRVLLEAVCRLDFSL